jgi:hypothetical protein
MVWVSTVNVVRHHRSGVNAGTRLWLVISVGLAAVTFASDPNLSESSEPPAQPSAGTPPQAVVQPPAVASPGPSAMSGITPPDPASGGNRDAGAQPGEGAPFPAATAQPIANKPGTKNLVDDTVTDAQLRQILRKGYQPEAQARGNEVYYCRRERDLGSRFETKVCRTAARILQEEQQGKEATTNVERTDGNRPLK